MNKMIIVLDKICLIGIIGISFYAGYKTGSRVTEMKPAVNELINFANEVKKTADTIATEPTK